MRRSGGVVRDARCLAACLPVKRRGATLTVLAELACDNLI